ncbi:MAG: hypothetical protein HC880_18135 [Bacteroidia bacterium]|nr:hypothetical protein [Bacteroidia bacterium]
MNQEATDPEMPDQTENNNAGNNLVVVSEILPDRIYIIPVEKRPIFPGLMIPVNLNRKVDLEAIRQVWESESRILAIISSVRDLLTLNPLYQEQLKMLLSQAEYERPGMLMDLISSMLTREPAKLPDLLETFGLYERAHKRLLLLKEEFELAEIQEK